MGERVIVIGATGRLGRALGAHLAASTQARRWRLLGCARRAPESPLPGYDGFVTADRRDVDSLRRLLDGAQVIIDLCAFSAPDVTSLCAALSPDTARVVWASSLAERTPSRWHQETADDWDQEPLPQDPYGRGKREARAALERAAHGSALAVATLLLPQVVTPDDSSARERVYVEEALSVGRVLVAGSGAHRPCVASATQAAAALWALAHHPLPRSPCRFQLAPAAAPTLLELVQALLRGAGLPEVPLSGGRTNGGPHSGATERVDGARLRSLVSDVDWGERSVIDAYEALGARLRGTLRSR